VGVCKFVCVCECVCEVVCVCKFFVFVFSCVGVCVCVSFRLFQQTAIFLLFQLPNRLTFPRQSCVFLGLCLGL